MATMRSLVLLVVCASIYGQVARAQVSQAGFLYIACGADTGFVDPETTLVWQPDTDYISTGAVGVADTETNPEYNHFRYFRNDTRVRKNCYTLPVAPATNYTLRASFGYVNQEVLGDEPPTFALAVDGTVVANVSTSYYAAVTREVTYQSGSGNSTSLCLLSGLNDVGPRFISAIALRPAVMYRRFSMYLDDKKIIRVRSRLNFGGTNVTRFPQDYNDRIWSAVRPNSTILANSTAPVQVLNTTHKMNLTLYKDFVPENVLQSAVTVQNGNLTINVAVYSPVSHMILHFAELDNHTSNVSRKFLVHVPSIHNDSYVNARNFSGEPYKPFYWYFWNLAFTDPVTPLTFYSKPRSRLGPLINALELFTIYDTTSSTTLDQDVQAIESLKVGWNLSEWTGDPCVPVPHSWLSCTLPTDLTEQPRVTTLDLSGYNLAGDIPASTIASLDLTSLLLNNNSLTGTFPNLTALRNLQTLHLQNNQLSGSLPVSLVAMPSLRQLNVQNNNLSGTIPAQLLAPPFNLTYRPGNPFLKEPSAPTSTTTNNTAAKSVGHVSAGVIVTIAILTSLYT